MKAHVDEDLCIGCALCEDLCPEVFELRDDGLSHVIKEDAGPDLYDCIRDAESSCPTEAISVTCDEGA